MEHLHIENPVQVKKVLCPLDFSEVSCSVLRYASGIAKQSGATLHLIHVLDTAHPSSVTEQEAVSTLSRFVAQLATKGVHVVTSVKSGDPAAVISEEAVAIDADVIIIGSHGQTGLTRLLLGNTAETLVRKSPRPVFVVKLSEPEGVS